MKKIIATNANQFPNESEVDNLSKAFKLKKVDALSGAYDAVNKNIINEYDLRVLEDIYKLIENGEIEKAQNKVSKLDSLVKPFAPDVPRNKIKGKVDFEMIDTHNIRIAGKGEFSTSMVKCLKCKNCGHSWVNEKEPD